MSLLSECPMSGILSAVPEVACSAATGQITKIAFQIIQDAPSFSAATIGKKATWTPLLAATNATKIVLSPALLNCVIPGSELNSEGGNDNTTIGGIRNVKGLNSVTVTAEIHNIHDDTKQALQKLFSLSKAPMAGITQIWAYLLTREGHVMFKNNGEGFFVYNVALTDPALEGINKDDVFKFSFDLKGGWSDGRALVKTDFNTMLFKNPEIQLES